MPKYSGVKSASNNLKLRGFLDSYNNDPAKTEKDLLSELIQNKIVPQTENDLFEIRQSLGKNYMRAYFNSLGQKKTLEIFDKIMPAESKKTTESLRVYFSDFFHVNDPFIQSRLKVQGHMKDGELQPFMSTKDIKQGLLNATDLDKIDERFSRVAIQLRIERERQLNPLKNIQLLDIADLHAHFASIDTKKDQRYQLIVDNNGHYTPVDIFVKNGVKQCIILDAANDPRMNDINEIAKIYDFKQIYMPVAREENKQLQQDLCSCPVFAFDYSDQLSQMSEGIYDDLSSKLEDGQLYFDSLPPNLVRNAQSMKFLEGYKKKLQTESPELLKKPMPNGKTLDHYLDEGKREVDGKVRNYSINQRCKEMMSAVKVAIQSPALPIEQSRSTLERFKQFCRSMVVSEKAPETVKTESQTYRK